MNVGINLIKYPQFFVIRIPKMCKFTIYENIEILCDYTMHDSKRNFSLVLVLSIVLLCFEMKDHIRVKKNLSNSREARNISKTYILQNSIFIMSF